MPAAAREAADPEPSYGQLYRFPNRPAGSGLCQLHHARLDGLAFSLKADTEVIIISEFLLGHKRDAHLRGLAGRKRVWPFNGGHPNPLRAWS